MKTKVVAINSEYILFENKIKLYSSHVISCCEDHYLSFEDLTLQDFEGLEFDLSSDTFFKKIEGYGIELIPVEGHSVKIPGYGHNNGCYSTNLSIILQGEDIQRMYDITECQKIEEY